MVVRSGIDEQASKMVVRAAARTIAPARMRGVDGPDLSAYSHILCTDLAGR